MSLRDHEVSIRRMVQKGVKHATIGRHLGYSTDSIARYCSENDIKSVPRASKDSEQDWAILLAGRRFDDRPTA